MVEREVTDCIKIVVNAKVTENLPAIMIVYEDETVIPPLLLVPDVLEIIKDLEKSGKLICVDSYEGSFSIFHPVREDQEERLRAYAGKLKPHEESRDTPACDVCGSITVRSGQTYKCLNCGNSIGIQ